MSERPEVLIGEFARRCRLPVSTLRYYDRIGLLVPAFVDESSGYRRYAAGQLPTAELIWRLRELGVAPQRIARVMAGGVTATEALLAERRRITQELDQGRRHLAELDALLAGDLAMGPIELIELTSRQVVVLPYSARFDDLEAGVTRAIALLRATLREAEQRRAGPWGATFPLDLTDEVEGMVFAPVEGAVAAGLVAATLPACRAASSLHRGSTLALGPVYRAAFDELDRLGEKPCAPVREDYLPLGPERAVGVRVSVPFALA
ncbi:MerR family DNA-binding transcriptional regulator [Sporichthya sp.]|uniref:MerR family transcriptional regulator n=1 Tax=Sporichthya sp. TaxID=65475 RepID=UPI00182B2599|nr:MerR family DNA-binding transcriptional regulator [Sporichthya sp.]MBA3744156.1 MerR family DNA-binding transcriptional regulator [Sporichthya sp.]